jgi:hypothetical protein
MSILRSITDAATRGPWEYDLDNGSHAVVVKGYSPHIQCDSIEDANFVVTARDVMPLLLDLLDLMREQQRTLARSGRAKEPGALVDAYLSILTLNRDIDAKIAEIDGYAGT